MPSGFNPRAHAGRDTSEAVGIEAEPVSIHAPTRGATGWDASVSVRANVSIHAPTRGATANPTMGDGYYRVSIHAPTRGATLILTTFLYCH